MLIDGSVGHNAGQIEIAVEDNGSNQDSKRDTATPIAVLSHPHPQYGGSMHDAVLHCAAKALGQADIPSVRFNFRGVGASSGQFDHGNGECDDLAAVCAWAEREFSSRPLWVVGYSFGAHVTYRTLPSLSAERALLIAPPVGMMSFDPINSDARVHAIAGDQDDFVDRATFADWEGVATELLPGADHFFAGQQARLEAAITQWISAA